MSTRLSFYFLLMLLVTCAGLLGRPSLANVPPATQEWSFRVFLDQKEIGFHDYRVIDEGDTRRVVTEASFDVRILFINAFRYRHRNVETWDADCLTGIDASTDANGARHRMLCSAFDKVIDMPVALYSRAQTMTTLLRPAPFLK